jgi:nucleoside-diphosphate-sugar epimerase
MRVCVTGGTGFIGNALVRRLLSEGDTVRALARPSPRADALEALGAEVIRGDLSDAQAIERAVAGAEAVYHIAAKVTGPWSTKDIATGLSQTQNVFEACIRRSVSHVVHVSSIAVYGLVKSGEVITESTPFDPVPHKRDIYAQSKIATDQYALAIGQKTKLAVTILRPGVVYGPGRLLPVALLGFSRGKTNVVFGRRELRYPMVYLEDLVDAIEMAGARRDGGLREYIVIGDDDLVLGQYHAERTKADGTRTLFFLGWPLLLGATIYEFVAWFIAFGSQPGPVWRRQIRRALQNRHYSTQRIRQELGWAPKVLLREAISRTLNSTTANQ